MNNDKQEYSYRSLRLPEASVAESLLVVSLRLWMLERNCATDVRLPDWRGGLCAIGFEHIADDVVVPMFEFLYGNRQGIEVLPLHCTRVSWEESNFLVCVMLMQQQRTDELQRLLCSYTFPATARVVMALIARFVGVLEEAGMRLPLRRLEGAAQSRSQNLAVRVH